MIELMIRNEIYDYIIIKINIITHWKKKKKNILKKKYNLNTLQKTFFYILFHKLLKKKP